MDLYEHHQAASVLGRVSLFWLAVSDPAELNRGASTVATMAILWQLQAQLPLRLHPH